MSFSVVALSALVLYSLGAAAYVYRWRGRTRWAGPVQYLRKAWPIFAPLNCILYMTTRPWARLQVRRLSPTGRAVPARP